MRLPRPKFLIAFLALAVSLASASADTPKVTAALSNDRAAVGEPVQLQIRVTGGGSAAVPGEIAIDGLEIHQTGTSRQVEVQNFNISQSIIYNYTVLPTRSGTFRIPPQTIKIGGNSYRTPELQLLVEGTGPPNNASGAGGSPKSGRIERNARLGFAEIIVTKQTAYVGEMVPVEIRIGLNAHSRPRLVDGPEIPSQSFTMQKLQAPDQPRMESINGVPYEVLTFKTAIAAARPGKFEIGPVQAGALVLVSRQSGSRSRGSSPFDMFNLDDPFSDPFFTDPWGAVGRQEKISVKSQPATIEIKALPANAPPSFDGAVGNFNLHVDANPKKVQVGDPITVTAIVGGRGNFDRVTAPLLQDERGWHTYPPSSKFKQDDDVGFSGTKTFEAVISPNERKDSVPPLEFTYFDPLAEKYVTLKSDAVPIHVEGEPLPAAKAPAGSTAGPAPTPPQKTATPSPQMATKPGEILIQLDERRQEPQSFLPVFAQKNFWLAQIAPVALLLAFLAWKVVQARQRDAAASRMAAWQRELGNLRKRLRNGREKPAEFFADASRILQIRTALLSGSDPNTVSATEAGKVLQTDDQTRARIHEIFDRRDEFRYSGSSNSGASLGAGDREHFAQLVEDLSR